MATVKYGLSENGFKRKRLPEVIQSLNDRVSDKLGIQIQTGANSVFGQLHSVYAYEIADLWAVAEDCYKSMYPTSAQGDSLSSAAGLAGIQLIQAEKTTLIASCYGMEGASVSYGAQISDGAHTYSCMDTNKTISADRASSIAVTTEGDPVIGTEYKLTVDGIAKTHTAEPGESATTILVDLYNQFNFTDRTGDTNNGVLTIKMNNEAKTMTVAVVNLTIKQIGSPFNFACDTAGAIDPVLGKVTQIPLTYTGWSAVSNNVAASVGRDAESDISLRQRWSSAVYSRAQAMKEAIRAAVYQNVTGVTACLVYENYTGEIDAEDRPPHCIEVVVDGGQPAEIAQEIWRRKAPGIDTYGAISTTVYDSQGVPQIINFNRPEQVITWFKIVISRNPDEELPAAAAQNIANAVLEQGNNQTIGQDVVLQRYFATVFKATSGIGYIDITAATGDNPSAYSVDNIVISARQVAVFAASRIEVIVNDD